VSQLYPTTQHNWAPEGRPTATFDDFPGTPGFAAGGVKEGKKWMEI